jgi:hypothetical protein
MARPKRSGLMALMAKAYSMVEVSEHAAFSYNETRIALNTDAKSIRVTNDRFAELTRALEEQGHPRTAPVKPASDLLIYVGDL